MRLRYLLPVANVFATVALVLVPLSRYSPNYTDAHGQEIGCHDNCPPLPSLFGIDSISFARGVNLPTAPFGFLLFQIAWDHGDHFPSLFWQGMAYGLAGVLPWLFVGRALEDLFKWRRGRMARVQALDFMFSVATALVSILWAVASVKSSNSSNWWMWVCITVWTLIGCSTLLMRAMQVVYEGTANKIKPS